MRAMMTAGPALDRCNVGAYNCAYLPVDSPRSFDEAMYILMCGTGVGFSVEEKYVSHYLELRRNFLTQIPLLSLQIVKRDGRSPSEKSSPCLLQVRSPNGMSAEYDLLVQDYERLEEELLDPSRLFGFLNLPYGFSEVPQDAA
jgi:hypothetical protein